MDLRDLPLNELRLLADQGDLAATEELGKRYFAGSGGAPKDTVAAARWLKIAADGGRGMAALGLAQMYLMASDYLLARKYLEIAAREGLAMGQSQLSHLLDQGLGGEADRVQALVLADQAANEDDAAAFYCASRFANGDGVDRDEKRAEHYLNLIYNRPGETSPKRLAYWKIREASILGAGTVAEANRRLAKRFAEFDAIQDESFPEYLASMAQKLGGLRESAKMQALEDAQAAADRETAQEWDRVRHFKYKGATWHAFFYRGRCAGSTMDTRSEVIGSLGTSATILHNTFRATYEYEENGGRSTSTYIMNSPGDVPPQGTEGVLIFAGPEEGTGEFLGFASASGKAYMGLGYGRGNHRVDRPIALGILLALALWGTVIFHPPWWTLGPIQKFVDLLIWAGKVWVAIMLFKLIRPWVSAGEAIEKKVAELGRVVLKGR